MGEASGVRVDEDDLATAAAVIEAMAAAATRGWDAVDTAQLALRERWEGGRSVEFDRKSIDLLDRARDLLARMDRIAPDLRSVLAGYAATDADSAAAVRHVGPT